MKIKIQVHLQKKGNRVAKCALEFDDLPGLQWQGFTICDDAEGLYVKMPSATTNFNGKIGKFHFLRENENGALHALQDAILDAYESMTSFNTPRVRTTEKV